MLRLAIIVSCAVFIGLIAGLASIPLMIRDPLPVVGPRSPAAFQFQDGDVTTAARLEVDRARRFVLVLLTMQRRPWRSRPSPSACPTTTCPRWRRTCRSSPEISSGLPDPCPCRDGGRSRSATARNSSRSSSYWENRRPFGERDRPHATFSAYATANRSRCVLLEDCLAGRIACQLQPEPSRGPYGLCDDECPTFSVRAADDPDCGSRRRAPGARGRCRRTFGGRRAFGGIIAFGASGLRGRFETPKLRLGGALLVRAAGSRRAPSTARQRRPKPADSTDRHCRTVGPPAS
jgi:hypothetical protein